MSETIISRRIRQQQCYGKWARLPEICLELRGMLNGSNDSVTNIIPAYRVQETYTFLKMVVETWQPNLSGNRLEAQLDDCVLQMVRTTIELVETNYPEKLI